MARKTAPLLPSSALLLQQLGERLHLARLRRGLTAKQVAERAGMAPMTLRSIERGSPGVTIGANLAVMQVLGLERDLQLVAEADTTGRALQDARLPHRSQHPLKPKSFTPIAKATNLDEAVRAPQDLNVVPPPKPLWMTDGGFTSAADILEPLTSEPKIGD